MKRMLYQMTLVVLFLAGCTSADVRSDKAEMPAPEPRQPASRPKAIAADSTSPCYAREQQALHKLINGNGSILQNYYFKGTGIWPNREIDYHVPLMIAGQTRIARILFADDTCQNILVQKIYNDEYEMFGPGNQ